MAAYHGERIAIVGAGLAGLATARSLLAHAGQHHPLRVAVYDRGGIGGTSASAVAAGLLHPLSPRGKLLWRGDEACRKSMLLVEEASAHAGSDPVVRQGLIKPARSDKQGRDFPRFASESMGWASFHQRGDAPVLHVPAGMVVDTRSYLEGLWRSAANLAAQARERPPSHLPGGMDVV